MRLITVFALCSVFTLSWCLVRPDIHFNGLVYCPMDKKWSWHIHVYEDDVPPDWNDYVTDTKGEGTDQYVYYNHTEKKYYDAVGSTVCDFDIYINHTCTEDGKQAGLYLHPEIHVPLFDKLEYYTFQAVNVKDKNDSSVYEKLFVKYLKDECGKTDCTEVLERIRTGCSIRDRSSECQSELDKAVKTYCNGEGSGQNICGNLKLYLIIGGSVGAAVLLIIVIVIVFIFYRKKKKARLNNGQQTVGTTTGTGTGTVTGTTATVGTNMKTGVEPTIPVERY